MAIAERLAWLKDLDMAVVVSQSQNEIDDLKKKGRNILPHRERLQKEELEAKFKDVNDPLRLVFVCAMWITGFDVPSKDMARLMLITQAVEALIGPDERRRSFLRLTGAVTKAYKALRPDEREHPISAQLPSSKRSQTL